MACLHGLSYHDIAGGFAQQVRHPLNAALLAGQFPFGIAHGVGKVRDETIVDHPAEASFGIFSADIVVTTYALVGDVKDVGDDVALLLQLVKKLTDGFFGSHDE